MDDAAERASIMVSRCEETVVKPLPIYSLNLYNHLQSQ
jgi:hypothetical protein